MSMNTYDREYLEDPACTMHISCPPHQRPALIGLTVCARSCGPFFTIHVGRQPSKALHMALRPHCRTDKAASPKES